MVSNIEMTPIPTFDFLERAEKFLRAYHELTRRTLFDWPRYFLLCHAVEMALKSP